MIRVKTSCVRFWFFRYIFLKIYASASQNLHIFFSSLIIQISFFLCTPLFSSIRIFLQEIHCVHYTYRLYISFLHRLLGQLKRKWEPKLRLITPENLFVFWKAFASAHVTGAGAHYYRISARARCTTRFLFLCPLLL